MQKQHNLFTLLLLNINKISIIEKSLLYSDFKIRDGAIILSLSSEYVVKIFTQLCQISSHQIQIDTKKSWAIFQNFNSWMTRYTKKPFGTWQFGNWCLGQSKIEVLKNCSAFFLCQFLWWEVNLRELRENLKHKNPDRVTSYS